MGKLFFAYPSKPQELGLTIESAIKSYNSAGGDKVLSWTAMDVIGEFIPNEILEKISKSTFVADITYLNHNVIYEIGYAIGQGKYILLVKNAALEEGKPSIQEVGIFDTLGFAQYQNSEELLKILKENKSNQPYKGNVNKNLTAPVYLMDTQYKTDFSSRIIARVNKAQFYYRTFDPAESPRLSANDAIIDVSESYGVIVQLLTKESKNATVHNLRAVFIAGLAVGMDVPYKIMQYGFDPVHIDYRDSVHVYRRMEDIDTIIADFAKDVMQAIQDISPSIKKLAPSFLEKLDLGASAAENEMRTLQNYYLRTDASLKASRGEVQLVTGRKGTGKSALFYQIVNKEKSSTKNIVLDLQPEGYKLIKFKEQVLDYLEEGTFQHTIMAFWEYLLLLEVAHKILMNDKTRYLSSENLRDPYQALEEAYKAEDYLTTGDFSERMSRLMTRLNQRFESKFKDGRHVRLSSPEVTGLIHQTNIKDLKNSLMNYLKYKERVWILFDNIDKGWPSSGLTQHDLIIIRTLIDASKNIQRYFERGKVNLYPIIFLRSDVYHHLVLGTSDRQKEAKVSLDWTDQDLLKRVIQLRILANEEAAEIGDDFKNTWREIAVSHYKGEDSLQFIVDRSLMRPRFLINFISHCKSFAVNLNHQKIGENDIAKGFNAYSADILMDINLEIRDVFPKNENVLTAFYTSTAKLTLNDLSEILSAQLGDNKDDKTEIVEILLWYGFLGVMADNEITYIYDVNYNIELLKTIIRKKGDYINYYINPSFWPALHIIPS